MFLALSASCADLHAVSVTVRRPPLQPTGRWLVLGAIVWQVQVWNVMRNIV
jgi:hypothetical protein